MAGNMIKRGVNIYIDQSEAQKAIETLQLRFQKLTNDMQALENQGKKGSKEWNRLSTNLQKVDADLKEVSSEVKLAELSMKQLESVKARLNAQLRTAIPGSEQWKQYANGIQTCETRLKELRAGARNTDGAINKLDNSVVKHQSSMTKLANSFNKYQALALGFIASITGVAFAIKNVIREFAKLDDVFANVSKNTGLTIEEVKELDERLKAYDTRTAREELLKLASEAGKAGETGIENLNGIVQSLDKIKVALGEDLGEDAITDLLKIANVSGLKDMMGTADAINAIGSAVNELGQKSVAKEAYIISFTQRLGGVAKQANISAQNIMGFASALDQAGMNVEMSSTALQQFLMKMMEDPAKFAKIAGLEVKSFTELVAKDTNAAIIQMLEAMHSKGGFQALIPMFSDMGTEGVRAVSVLSTLAGQIQGVKEAQELSNTAFTEGNSLTEEFNKRNNNAQAELDKAKKKFLENSVALGEKLYPAMKMSLSGASYLIKALGFLANNFYALIPLIGACAIALVAYNKQKMITWALDVKGTLQAYKWMLAETIKQNLIGKTTILTKAAAVAQALWNTAIAATGVGGMIILLGSLVTTLLLVTGAFDKTTKAQKALNEAQKATNDHMADEKARIEVLIAQINNENLSREERNKKLKELIAIAPEYLNKLTLDNIKTAEGTNIIKEYIKQLERKIHLQNLEK
ncbi:MAG: phage tail tape measure protein, partial [Erysipelotrichales bacterium]|nr:phage tail tape measure protein [Erysipelotrichales bacterium]